MAKLVGTGVMTNNHGLQRGTVTFHDIVEVLRSIKVHS